MKEKLLLILISACLFLSAVACMGCSNKKKDYNAATDTLKDIKSYTADVTLEVKNDKQSSTYKLKHYYSKGMGYRVDVDDSRVYVYDYKAKEINVNDLKSGFKYKMDMSFDNLFQKTFVTKFVEMLYTNEEIKYSTKAVEGQEAVLIDFELPGADRNLKKATLFINQKDSLPIKLLIFDVKDKEKIVVKYENFIANNEVKKETFEVK